jgi:hypothetical protein
MRGHFDPSIEVQGGASASNSTCLLCRSRAFALSPTVQMSNVVQIPLSGKSVRCNMPTVS